MMVQRISLGFTFLFLLVSCQHVGRLTQLPGNYYFRDRSNFGVVVYSQVSDRGSTQVYLDDRSNRAFGFAYTESQFSVFHDATINTDQYQGELAITALRKGNYVINRWLLQKKGTPFWFNQWGTEFEVKPKTILYLGRFFFQAKGGGTWVEVQDKYEEDIKNFRQANPKLAGLPVQKQLAQSTKPKRTQR